MDKEKLRCNITGFTISRENMKEVIEDVYKFKPTNETTEEMFRHLTSERVTIEAIRKMENYGRVEK